VWVGIREISAKRSRGCMAGDVDGEGYKRGGVGEGSKMGVFEVALFSPATEFVAGFVA